jgi:hypothetical protein
MSKDGKVFDRIVGFEDLGGIDDFKTINLIKRLVRSKIITPKNKHERGEINVNKGKQELSDDDYDY